MTAALLTGDASALDATAENMAGRNRIGRAAVPEDIAGAAVYLASDEAWYTNGHAIVVDGTMEALASKALRWYGQ
jgi:NAD(P)-dependent dehydrogenase (short-subunit alcohol dehydrogenase family)